MTKTDLTFPAFSLRFVDFAVQFCFCCKFSISFHNKWPLGMTVVWFSWTSHNSMLRIATNEIASFCVDTRLCQMAVWCLPKWAKADFQIESFWNKKGFSVSSLFLYNVKTTRLHVVMHCSVIDLRRCQNVVRTGKSDSWVCHWYSYHILTSSVIYYWTDAWQHGICFLILRMLQKFNPANWLIFNINKGTDMNL